MPLSYFHLATGNLSDAEQLQDGACVFLQVLSSLASRFLHMRLLLSYLIK